MYFSFRASGVAVRFVTWEELINPFLFVEDGPRRRLPPGTRAVRARSVLLAIHKSRERCSMLAAPTHASLAGAARAHDKSREKKKNKKKRNVCNARLNREIRTTNEERRGGGGVRETEPGWHAHLKPDVVNSRLHLREAFPYNFAGTCGMNDFFFHAKHVTARIKLFP